MIESNRRIRRRASNKKWYAENSKPILERMKKWRLAHPEQVEKNNQRSKKWREANFERKDELARIWRLKGYGWTVDMVEQTAVEQDGRCMICRQLPGKRGLVPDHVHATPPQPRALLCDRCNAAIGLLRESPEICRAAAEYIENWTA
jgi:hypothetical protein